ncbi:N(4)-(beta-N-acetylglucosaminyl)-L-asparaginase [Thermosediminibacter oceani]|uniref:N(4)-(Beta-N-acetylglucosaminyl)-L-asparaginase n=1 Tax=Thermosediminibacter oceani (strain ATCC BAA-1034 / DSM 16646 / JW/IW-1228P) TaxID=555079 RepID=D9S0C1_THEOJ|nr:N(4)-(beta-N-acetylglucosaminyl)-L-asparaginase [Thermosediminibacter oceani]ADL07049.1 N(4)-(beta-N-acetylglucosaminyl)-L-asparaginase [Thermosediminibacter oceani DSM 16646]
MKWAIIGTWRMSLEGIIAATEILKHGGDSGDAVEEAVKIVEDFPLYKSVGYGGLPNENCEVELDAAFMDGDTLSFGAVGGIRDFKNPVSIARKLSHEKFNIFLVGSGAEEYAHKNGFERKNMLTDRAKKIWEKRVKEIYEKNLSPYDGHDTVGVVCLDKKGHMTAATSTSGLFMKKRGRVGDSPICGSGLYVDSQVGGAVATGLGEDIMKGCLSYEAVRLMESGIDPQTAAEKAVFNFSEKLRQRSGKAGAISLVCINNKGEWGVGTNVEFSFVVATDDSMPKVYLAHPENGRVICEEASEEWLQEYQRKITSPV